MDEATYIREAPWMVPLLLFIVIGVVGAIVGLVIWIATDVRENVNKRLDKQDLIQLDHGKILTAIKDLLTSKFHTLDRRLMHHESRLTRLEDHNGLPPQRRYDDQDHGD